MASATVVTLPQMVDLALNSPEVGIVNFTVLHSLLHVIVKQLDLVDTNVEFRGSDSERLQSYIANAKPGPLLTLTEYTVGEEGAEKEDRKKARKGIHGIVEKGKTDEEQTEKEGPEQSESQNKVIVVESSRDVGGGSTVVVTKHHFDRLEGDVKMLNKKVKELAELPANSALIEVLRGENPDKTPVLDMFQILNLTKRLDAAEVGMQKLASLMEDLAKKGPISPEAIEAFSEKANELRKSLEDTSEAPKVPNLGVEKRLEKLEKAVFDGNITKKGGRASKLKLGESQPGLNKDQAESEAKLSPTKKPSANVKSSLGVEQSDTNDDLGSSEMSGSTQPEPERKTKQVAGKKPSPNQKTSQASKAVPKKTSPTTKQHAGASDDAAVAELTEETNEIPNSAIADVIKEVAELKGSLHVVVDDVEGIKKLLAGDKDAENLPPELRLNQLECKLNDCQEQVGSLDHMFCRQVEILQKRIMDLEKEAGELVEKVNLGMANADTTQPDGQSVGELYNKLLQLQEEMASMAENAQKLMDDREEKQHTLDIITEQIELLKTVKADREDLEDALADKADACMVNRKVSVEQFDAACGDMSKAIEESLEKLKQQEDLWTQALNDIQKDIGHKLDKMELVPLRDYINKKLKGLQEKFKSLTALRKDNEAAGTKSKFLRNVNCISCDKDVVMRREVDSSLFPKAYASPPARNIAPYLAYELDQLRKQQKRLPPTKDLNMLQNAIKGAKMPKGPDYLCNRYCGGSHTVTTPQQRVTRVGHFLEQWGPEITTATDAMIRGSDGHMYRGRDEKIVPVAESTQISPTTPEEATTPKTPSIHQTPPAKNSTISDLGQSKGEGEGPSTIKKTPKGVKTDSESKPAPTSTPDQTRPVKTDSESKTAVTSTPDQTRPPEESAPKRKSRSSIDRRPSLVKSGARRKSKSSVKYASKASVDVVQPETPAEQEKRMIEEPASDAETEHYADPDA